MKAIVVYIKSRVVVTIFLIATLFSCNTVDTDSSNEFLAKDVIDGDWYVSICSSDNLDSNKNKLEKVNFRYYIFSGFGSMDHLAVTRIGGDDIGFTTELENDGDGSVLGYCEEKKFIIFMTVFGIKEIYFESANRFTCTSISINKDIHYQGERIR